MLEAKWDYRSRCKANLTLDVFAPRPDGFHNLDSVVLRFSPCDKIYIQYELSEKHSVVLTCSNPALPTDNTNLAYKAAEMYLSEIIPDYPCRVTIDLHKGQIGRAHV